MSNIPFDKDSAYQRVKNEYSIIENRITNLFGKDGEIVENYVRSSWVTDFIFIHELHANLNPSSLLTFTLSSLYDYIEENFDKDSLEIIDAMNSICLSTYGETMPKIKLGFIKVKHAWLEEYRSYKTIKQKHPKEYRKKIEEGYGIFLKKANCVTTNLYNARNGVIPIDLHAINLLDKLELYWKYSFDSYIINPPRFIFMLYQNNPPKSGESVYEFSTYKDVYLEFIKWNLGDKLYEKEKENFKSAGPIIDLIIKGLK